MTNPQQPDCPTDYTWMTEEFKKVDDLGRQAELRPRVTISGPPYYNAEWDKPGDDGWFVPTLELPYDPPCASLHPISTVTPQEKFENLAMLRAENELLQNRVNELDSENHSLNLQIRDWQSQAATLDAENKRLKQLAESVQDELEKLSDSAFLAQAMQNWIANSDQPCESHWQINSDIQEAQIKKVLALLGGVGNT